MFTRRQFLKGMVSAAAVAPFLGHQDLLAQTTSSSVYNKKGTAKSIIQIWMWGGPSHLDTFDPKPEAGPDFTGPLTSPIETNVPGIRIGEQLPMLAKQADKYSVIRSMTHGVNAHETASYLVQTGRPVGGERVYPAIGAITSMLKGEELKKHSTLPPYIVLTTSQGRFSKAGFLGSKYKPFITGGNPNKEPFLVEGYVVEGVDQNRQEKRRRLLSAFDTFGGNNESLAQLEESRENAYKQILGGDMVVFDLKTEEGKVREAYGRTWFGQACLMARRLVEQGVPYITINYPGWDTHKQHFQTLARVHSEMDRGMATLLQDLSDRGLLDQTIVWWGGEFGRTPRVQWDAPWNGGRSHFGHCFSTVVAGGGFEGGQIVGASSRTGEEVAERPVYPQDLLGSFLELMGINPDAPMPNPAGIDVPIMEKASNGGRLHEIMKG